MDLEPTEEQRALAEALHEFSANEIRPAARECEETGRPSERITKQLFEMGVATPVPAEFGGQGSFDAVTSVIIAEEIAWGDPGVAFCVLHSGAAAVLIDLAGTGDQRRTLLTRITEGAIPTVAFAERDAGADFTELDATATIEGGVARLSGTKYAVPLAEDAAIRLVAARAGGALALWLVPADAELIAQPEDKLGLRSAKTYKLLLDGLEVPAESVLGGAGADPRKIELGLLRVKLINAGIALGLARASLEYASDYAKERTAFGKPIGTFQGISFKIADRATELESARLMVWEAAHAVDRGREDAIRKVVAACGQTIAAAVATADDGVQVLGGHGYMRDHPQEMWYRDAMTLATLDSPSMVGDLFLANLTNQTRAERAEKAGVL